MKTHALRSLKVLAKRLTALLVSVVMLLSLTQTGVLAAASPTQTESVDTPGVTEPIPGENINKLKEQRREWQGRTSSARDVEDDKGGSLGETLKTKLNLDEIIEGYDPQKEAEKRSSPTP